MEASRTMKQILGSRNRTALFLAILFHVCGAAGILWTPYKDWFVRNTFLTLFLMTFLLIWTQTRKNGAFFSFLLIAFMLGTGTEMIGVNTGKLFGNYQYHAVMGRKWNGVPFIIGLNWFSIVYCSGMIIQRLHDWIEDKYATAGMQPAAWIQKISFIIDGALIATFFDWLMEPVAVKLGFWSWLGDGHIPLYNYTCWFLISLVLLMVFRWLNFTKHNHFAIHLYIIQLLFFLLLKTFL